MELEIGELQEEYTITRALSSKKVWTGDYLGYEIKKDNKITILYKNATKGQGKSILITRDMVTSCLLPVISYQVVYRNHIQSFDSADLSYKNGPLLATFKNDHMTLYFDLNKKSFNVDYQHINEFQSIYFYLDKYFTKTLIKDTTTLNDVIRKFKSNEGSNSLLHPNPISRSSSSSSASSVDQDNISNCIDNKPHSTAIGKKKGYFTATDTVENMDLGEK